MTESAAEPRAVDALFVASAVPLTWHAGGSLDEARALLAAHPQYGASSIHAAAVTGDVAAVRAVLNSDPSQATAKGGAHGWDPLTWCCFSRFFRDDVASRPAFLAIAEELLKHGASASTGFLEPNHAPAPTFETVLYGAAGIAFDAPMTALLLAHGADPNDDETP
jgi:hypothetical protein